MTRKILLGVCLIALSATAFSQNRLQGEIQAVDRIERMLERLGGADVWARTRTLHLVYHGWGVNPNEPIVEHAWRDLSEPAEYLLIEGRTFKYQRVFFEQSGWTARDNQVRVMSPEEHQTSIKFWPRDFYTMIRRFAVADQDLALRFEAPRRVYVDNNVGDNLGWWDIDSAGQPIVWGTIDEGEVLEYIYLPVKVFGNVAFPAGGVATDGSWRFEYHEIDVSIDPIPLSLEPTDDLN